jgi:hypothetical protein
MVNGTASPSIINLSAKGTFARSGELQTRPEEVEAVFDRLRKDRVSHLVLYFHGGLVSESDGQLAARALGSIFQKDGQTYPVFFVWESGWLEMVRSGLDRIAQQELFKTVSDAVMNFVLSKLKNPADSRSVGGPPLFSDAELVEEKAKEIQGGSEVSQPQRESLEEVTQDEAEQLERFLQNNYDFQAELDEITARVESDGPSRDALGGEELESRMLSSEVVNQLRKEADQAAAEHSRSFFTSAFLIKSALRVFIQVVRRVKKGTDHGIYCTVVEETLRQFYVDKVGAWLWRSMKEKIRHAFDSNDGLSEEALHGGTYFLEKLRDYLKNAPAPLKVSLVGHSAGAIYVCRLLERAYETLDDSFRFHQVILLAPAVDFELFRQTVVGRASRFHSFRMFALQDDYEARDKMVPVVYPRSLLYFVSGLLEGDEPKPLVGMQRFYSGQPPYDSDDLRQVGKFVSEEGKSRVVWSVAADGTTGLTCGATSHGSFALDQALQQSLIHLLNT